MKKELHLREDMVIGPNTEIVFFYKEEVLTCYKSPFGPIYGVEIYEMINSFSERDNKHYIIDHYVRCIKTGRDGKPKFYRLKILLY